MEKPKPTVGTEVIEIKGVDTAGRAVVLDRAFYKKQKYTVIDFGASWCGPCRQLNAKYREVYDELQKNGVRIVGFALDTSETRWKGAIKADQTPWLHISDLKANGSLVVRHYGIDAIPTSFMVDRLGKIAARDLSPAQLLELAKAKR